MALWSILLRQELAARNWRDRIVCIDEIQRCPDLLNEVHLMIEEHDLRFLLTGSSARGLRALREENLLDRFILVCREERSRQVDGMDILPWETFFQQLWEGGIVPGTT